MWVLVLILLTGMSCPISGEPGRKLEEYTTKEKCIEERDRIMIDMIASYPGDADYQLICVFKQKSS